MKVRMQEGDSSASSAVTHTVGGEAGIVFLVPSSLCPVQHVRFYDDKGVMHQFPATQLLSVEP